MKNAGSIFLFLLLVIVIAMMFFGGLKEPNLKNENLHSTLWTQAAVEYPMITTQAYKLAMINLEMALQDKNWTAALEQTNEFTELPPAVILDIDETVLDNSPFQARLVKMNVPYNENMWFEWVKEANADYIKGSLEFIKFAKSKGVGVFYVTNRLFANELPTFENLKKLGFPVESPDELLMKNEKENWGSDKTSRRQFVADNYRVVMLVGDDANDFMNVRKDLPADRFTKLGEYSENWGKSWIILPNPQYGSWERASYGFEYSLSERQKLEKKLELLHTK